MFHLLWQISQGRLKSDSWKCLHIPRSGFYSKPCLLGPQELKSGSRLLWGEPAFSLHLTSSVSFLKTEH